VNTKPSADRIKRLAQNAAGNHRERIRLKIARALWDRCQRDFPPFTKQKWDDGTQLARDRFIGDADAVLDAIKDDLK
jgi:hypothetical protein